MRYYHSEEDYDAMGVYDAGREDVETTLEKIEMEHPTMTCDKDSVTYLTYQSGSSNKFHCFVLAQDRSGSWFAFNGAARIGYSPRLHRIYGPASIEQCRRAMSKKISAKKRKGYSDYFQGKKWYATAETYGAEMQYMELPVIPDSYGNDSATEMGGRGVPVWYGSAENWDGPRVRRPNASDYIFDHDNELEEKLNELHDEKARLDEQMRHFRKLLEDISGESGEGLNSQRSRFHDLIDKAQDEKYKLQERIEEIMSERGNLADVRLGAEGMEMTPDIEGYPGLPVVPDSYGTNSALASGQGVPVWYGSAEDANPSGGSTGNQVVSWEHGGLSSPSGPPSDIYWAEGRGSKWSEADAAHVLLRRKAKKQRTIDRKRSRHQKYSAEGERIRNAGELVDYVDDVMDGKVSIVKPFTLPTYLDELISQDKSDIKTSQDEMDIYFHDGSMASCIYDARNNTLNTFVVAYGGDDEYNSETIDSQDWDKTEYEKKDLEIVKPFGTAMKATMGVAAGTAAILGIMVALTKLGGNNE